VRRTLASVAAGLAVGLVATFSVLSSCRATRTGVSDSTSTDTTPARRAAPDSTATDPRPSGGPGTADTSMRVPGRPADTGKHQASTSDDALMQQILATPYGQVLLTTARHMKVGQDTIAVVAMVQGTAAPIARAMKVGSVTAVDSALIGRFMRATLAGEGFAISTADTAEQIVASDQPTEWMFTVRPVRSGALTLYAHIAQRFLVGTRQEMRSLEAKPLSVNVEANYAFTVSDWIDRHGKDILTYLVPSGALIGFLKWLIERRAKRKEIAGIIGTAPSDRQ